MTASTTTVLLSQIEAISFALGRISDQPFWNTPLFGSIVTLIVTLFPWFYLVNKDRPRIKMSVNPVLIARPGPILRSGFSAHIYNFGRRPIKLCMIYLRYADGESLVFLEPSNFEGGSSGLPMQLDEGDSHTVTIRAGVFAESFLEKKDYPTSICFEDALGRVYKASTSREFWDKIFKSENAQNS